MVAVRCALQLQARVVTLCCGRCWVRGLRATGPTPWARPWPTPLPVILCVMGGRPGDSRRRCGVTADTASGGPGLDLDAVCNGLTAKQWEIPFG